MLGAALVAMTGSAHAETLRDAMARAYKSNPDINAARSDLRATDEGVPLAKSQSLPQLNATGGYTESILTATNSYLSPPRQAAAQAQLSIPIYQGGAVRNGIAAAETRVKAGRATLRGNESNLFTNVVAAYMDVIRDSAIVKLNEQNVHVLEVNLKATKDRFEVGDLTRTDVAQSEARLAQAHGQLRNAQAQLITSRENYIAVVGVAPDDLQTPPPLPNLPNSPATAVDVALKENPSLIAARRNRKASAYDVSAAKAARLPKVSVVVGGSYYNYLNSLPDLARDAGVDNSGTAAQAGVQLTLPIFQGGRPAAQVRQAKAREGVALEQETSTERTVISKTRSAYAAWQSSEDLIKTSQVAVKANQLSLKGVRAENSVGTRTILDILNAEQELLNSQVDLVTAQRNAYVAGFALLASMGKAEAKDLGLDGGGLYDPTVHYNKVRGSFWDWNDGPPVQAVGTGTADTKPQTADVEGGLDPEMQTPAAQKPE
ncbi:TolC family outer membrane protein [Stakelama sediminis]